MKKIIAFLIALAIAIPILTGCGGEPEPMEPVSAVEAVEHTEDGDCRLAFGDIVYSVRTSEGDGEPYVVRYMVFAQKGELVAVVPMFTADANEFRKALENAARMPLDGTGHLYLVELNNCYNTPEEAGRAME